MSRTVIDVIDAAEVSRRTGLSVRALRRRRELGQEPVSFRLGGRVVYDPDDVDEWIKRQRDEGLRRVSKDPSFDDRVNAWVQRNLDNAPDLTVEQRELLRRILRSPNKRQDVA